MAVLVGVVGTALFGREIGLLAVSPISGGAVASAMVAEVATNAGRADLAALAMLFNVVQLLFGVPVSSFLLRKYCTHAVEIGIDQAIAGGHKEVRQFHFRLLKPVPEKLNNQVSDSCQAGPGGLCGPADQQSHWWKFSVFHRSPSSGCCPDRNWLSGPQLPAEIQVL